MAWLSMVNYCRVTEIIDSVQPYSRTRTSAEVQTQVRLEQNELWAGASLHFGYTLSDGTWKKRTKDMHLSMHYFFIFLMYIHLYPVKDTALGILRTTMHSVMRMPSTFFIKRSCRLREIGAPSLTIFDGTTDCTI